MYVGEEREGEKEEKEEDKEEKKKRKSSNIRLEKKTILQKKNSVR